MTTSTSAPDPRRWWALFLLCAAQFLVILDTSIVGIALPALQRALGFDAAGLQWIFGYGAFESGLALLPMTLAIMLLMMLATEKVVGRIGPKAALVLGLGVLGLALVLFSRMPAGGSFVADVLLPSLLGAVGMSLAYIPAMITSTAAARPEDGGLASGLVNTTYQVGSAIGLAAMVAVAGAKASSLAASGAGAAAAMNGGFSAAFLGAGAIALGAAVLAALAVRAPSSSAQPEARGQRGPSAEARRVAA